MNGNAAATPEATTIEGQGIATAKGYRLTDIEHPTCKIHSGSGSKLESVQRYGSSAIVWRPVGDSDGIAIHWNRKCVPIRANVPASGVPGPIRQVGN